MVDATATGTIIRAEDLCVYYSGKPAVTEVTMDVPNHKITAIIGPSGCARAPCCEASTG